jgi:hypothetical protein
MVIVKGQLRTDMALFAVAQDIVESTRTHLKRCMFSGLTARIAQLSLNRSTKLDRNSMPEMPASRSSLTSRSCNVRFTRSTRPFVPLAWAGVCTQNLFVQLMPKRGRTVSCLAYLSRIGSGTSKVRLQTLDVCLRYSDGVAGAETAGDDHRQITEPDLLARKTIIHSSLTRM